MHNIVKSNDDDFIEVGLGGMGYSCKSYKKIVLNYKFIRGRFQTGIFKKINILQVIMFQNVLIDLEILKKNQLKKKSLWSLCVLSKKTLESLCLSNVIQM
jgi:hypothetical protein